MPYELSPRLFLSFDSAFLECFCPDFDVCGKCQHEYLPKPAGKKKMIESRCERARKNHVLSN